jgi:hypothetical protein
LLDLWRLETISQCPVLLFFLERPGDKRFTASALYEQNFGEPQASAIERSSATNWKRADFNSTRTGIELALIVQGLAAKPVKSRFQKRKGRRPGLHPFLRAAR